LLDNTRKITASQMNAWVEAYNHADIETIIATLKTLGYIPTIEKVAYAFQKDGDEMLRVRRSK